MLRTLFAAAALAAAVSLSGSPAVAQTTPSNCAAAAARASDNILLRMQTPALGAENRESAKAHLAMASNAAAAGNEAECWKQLQISSLFVAPPSAPNPQTGVAGAADGGH